MKNQKLVAHAYKEMVEVRESCVRLRAEADEYRTRLNTVSMELAETKTFYDQAWRGRYDASQAENKRLSEALRLLWREVQESGNAMAGNDGWPKAIAATRQALEQYDQERTC